MDEVRTQRDVPGAKNPPPARSDPPPPRLASRASVDYERVPGVPEVPDGWGAEAWPPKPPTPQLTLEDIEGVLTRMRAWLVDALDPTADLAEALGHDRYDHPGRAAMLDEVRRSRRVNAEWEQVMSPLVDGLAVRNVKVPLGRTWVDAALAEIDRLREAAGHSRRKEAHDDH